MSNLLSAWSDFKDKLESMWEAYHCTQWDVNTTGTSNFTSIMYKSEFDEMCFEMDKWIAQNYVPRVENFTQNKEGCKQ